MKKKSKFLTFIFSFVPGLGHIYLGFAGRGAVFFFAIVLLVIVIALFSGMSYRIGFNAEILAVIFPLIWIASLTDSMMIAERINKLAANPQDGASEESLLPDYGQISRQNRKVISMFLSVIPGAGHMYLGLQKQGIQLMAGFFLAFYLTDWLRLGILMIIVPIIWFYSLFDVMHKVSGNRPMTDDDLINSRWMKEGSRLFSKKSVFGSKDKAIGYGAIFIGTMLIFNRMIYPFIVDYIDPRISGNISTGIVALLLIAGGIKLVTGTKNIDNFEEEN